MKFKIYYFKEDYKIDNWESIIDKNPYLKAAIEVINIIDKKFPNTNTYLVGGVVRDLVMQQPFKDVDLATNADVEEIEKLFKSYNLGANKSFGIVGINYKGFPIEIAHFRSEEGYSDSRRPDKVTKVKDFKTDASRRDISWNAMALDKEGNVIDHFGGMEDIKNKILRMVGNPEDRVKEDALRLMRIPRFAARFGFDIDYETLKAVKSNAPKIKNIAVERIVKELKSMATSGPKFANAIELLIQTGLLKEILPEVLQMSDMPHSQEHHPESPNVLGHVLSALRASPSKDSVVLLAILMHDLGKNVTYKFDNGRHTYHGHDQAAIDVINKIADRLKLDTQTKDAIIFAAENHMLVHKFLEVSNSKIAKLMGSPHFQILMDVAYADAAARGNKFDKEEWQKIVDRVESIKQQYKDKDVIDKIGKVVNGRLIMDLTGLTSNDGPEIGRIKKAVVDEILNNNVDIEDMNVIKKLILQFKGRNA